MKRKLLIFAATASLLLCLATCGLWFRSYRACDAIGRYRGGAAHPQIMSDRGEIAILRQCGRADRRYAPEWSYGSYPPGGYNSFPGPGSGFQYGGFGFLF